jgi:hypothetical protein
VTFIAIYNQVSDYIYASTHFVNSISNKGSYAFAVGILLTTFGDPLDLKIHC